MDGAGAVSGQEIWNVCIWLFMAAQIYNNYYMKRRIRALEEGTKG
jgi:hypothetical protein